MVLEKFQRIFLGKLSCYGIGKISEDFFGKVKLLHGIGKISETLFGKVELLWHWKNFRGFIRES